MSAKDYAGHRQSDRELIREAIVGERPHSVWTHFQPKNGLKAPVEHGHHNKRTPSDDMKKGAGRGK